MKTKYERMTKEEKKELKEFYKKTSNGKVMCDRLMRVNIVGILLLLYAVYSFVSHIDALKWSDYVISIPIFIIGLVFLILSYRLKKKVLNQFAIKNSSKSKK